jgi:hypothetical protein
MVKVLGIKIIDRIKEAGLTQEILSGYGSVITTRLGFHEVTDSVCSREAYIILHLKDDRDAVSKLEKELEPLGGIVIREMAFGREPYTSATQEGDAEILGILLEKEHDVVISVQKILTSYGCNIRTRLGVNENFFGVPSGLIILELKGDKTQFIHLENDLRKLPKVQVRTMVF